MEFPGISDALRIERLQPPAGRVRMVLDTDTYNEIDDQFAVVYSLLASEKLNVEAFYAAPYHNSRSEGPADGMEKSYEEILRLLDQLGVKERDFVYRGSRDFLTSVENPISSEAQIDLIERAMKNETDPLYVVAIGAITNVASAILMEPKIIERIVIVWLGGQSLHWPHNREFNLSQDVIAAGVIFDCGVPLVQLPAGGVVTHLRTTIPEMEQYVRGRGAIGDYLATIFAEYKPAHVDARAWSKEIWDIAGIAYLLNANWIPSQLVPSPILTLREDIPHPAHKGWPWQQQSSYWSFDQSRHLIRSAYYLDRDAIFRDLFNRLDAWADGAISLARP